jgi:hypothetical protein
MHPSEDFTARSWSFFGQIFPHVPVVNLTVPFHEASSSLGLEFSVEGHAFQSKVVARVIQNSPADIFTLRNSVTSALQMHADLLGFRMGTGLEVYIDAAQSDDGQWHIFEGYIPALRNNGTFDFPPEHLDAIGKAPAAHAALADFRSAIRVPLQTGFFCYRAIESMMQSVKIDGEKDAVSWDRLRTDLNVSRAAIDRIKAHADWARHGGLGELTDADRVMLLTTARSAIGRYLDYLVGGKVSLPADTYPTLT